MISLVIDTCILVGNRSDLLKKYREYINTSDYSKLLTDDPGGPCSLEILKHSPSDLGAEYRREIAYTGRIFDKHVYAIYIGMLKKSYKVRRINNHSGEPTGELAEDLSKMVEGTLIGKKKARDWWEKDRMWVSLAQHASPVDICSFDKGFRRAARVLKRHGIGLRAD